MVSRKWDRPFQVCKLPFDNYCLVPITLRPNFANFAGTEGVDLRALLMNRYEVQGPKFTSIS